MTTPDFNLLITLNVLLEEGSVAAAFLQQHVEGEQQIEIGSRHLPTLAQQIQTWRLMHV